MNYILLLVLNILFVYGNDCPYKECFCSYTDVFCSYKSFKTLPQKIPYNSTYLRSLYLDGNFITKIPAGSLPANISYLSLQGTPIETIDDTAFNDSIYTLQQVIFSQAGFTQLPKAITHLKSLTTLNIESTNINNWTDDTMNQLGSTLQTLSLSAVGLTSWPNWMNSMTNLTSLSITGCYFQNIPDNAFNGFANILTILNIGNNGLTTLPKSLLNLTSLNSLNLYNNSLIELKWLPQSKYLNTIYLDNNKITDAPQLSDALRHFSDSLTNFDVEYNFLTSIPDLTFFTKITGINLNYNHITIGSSGSFPYNITNVGLGHNFLSFIPNILNNYNSITWLYLGYNIIQNVQGIYIPSTVQTLDLSYNVISEISKSSFPLNSSLYYLYLNNNPLSIISSDAFEHLGALTNLDLENTKLTRVPLAVASLKKLTYLDISNNPSLVCTCQEQSLYTWVKRFPYFDIYGNCGMIGVYQFFVMLSPGCPPLLQ